MKVLGKFAIEAESDQVIVQPHMLREGINDLRDYIIKVGEKGEVLYVIDKVCDHAGGKLIVKGQKAVCPMHNWQLNLGSLRYNNSHECKKEADYEVDQQGQLIIQNFRRQLRNPFRPQKTGEVKVRWLNHATVLIECNGITLMTDPWLFGPAFLTGWWLYSPSPLDSIELLKKVDFIYISHNHPDHLHAETLALVGKDKPILTPHFQSNSSARFLKSLGFQQVIEAEFLDILELGEGFQVSILKSGDFRDDSGIYVCANGYELLLTVDSNYLNSHVLPTEVDLLMSSFAGGASGFPLCYENYSEEEKLNVLKRNRTSIKSNVLQYMKASRPRYYMPYAGMFSEYADRDRYIRDRNLKNTYADYEKIAKGEGIQFIRPQSDQVITLKEEGISKEDLSGLSYLKAEDTAFYITNFREDYLYDAQKVIDYLRNSGYHSKQILQLIPTDDSFENIVGEIVFADFYEGEFKVIPEGELVREKPDYRVMQLKVRAEIIMCVVENYLPWEDMSIGFQVRASRYPNEYESDFWYHFTNNYIAKENFRYSSFCGACTIIDQNPIWAKVGV